MRQVVIVRHGAPDVLQVREVAGIVDAVGAGGGVGIAATQLARLRGATIIGTASSAKHDAIRRQGVHHAID